ncbi:YrhA family protein, partial [Enterobacter bugandensis]
VKNLFVMNDFYRDNDDYINPDLAQRLVIGEDSISLFTYDTKSNLFEIRDNVGTENVFGSFDNFTDFLREILDTVA